MLPLPFTLAAVQLLAGVPYVWLLWMVGLRKRPKLTLSQVIVVSSEGVMLVYPGLTARVTWWLQVETTVCFSFTLGFVLAKRWDRRRAAFAPTD